MLRLLAESTRGVGTAWPVGGPTLSHAKVKPRCGLRKHSWGREPRPRRRHALRLNARRQEASTAACPGFDSAGLALPGRLTLC
ncbi:hypothetical protein SLG_01230 [Sphingobium sp. SYK-6]|nr:hypothetical protein SLG_01230 [Sphingobium sp. SYK-6]